MSPAATACALQPTASQRLFLPPSPDPYIIQAGDTNPSTCRLRPQDPQARKAGRTPPTGGPALLKPAPSWLPSTSQDNAGPSALNFTSVLSPTAVPFICLWKHLREKYCVDSRKPLGFFIAPASRSTLGQAPMSDLQSSLASVSHLSSDCSSLCIPPQQFTGFTSSHSCIKLSCQVTPF